MKKFLKTKEDFLQYKYLNIPLNVDGSGYTRYGAAMYFYNKGLISEEILEKYRICCKFDSYDPKDTSYQNYLIKIIYHLTVNS